MMDRIAELLGNEADSLLKHQCRTVPNEKLHPPGPDFVDRVHRVSDRNIRVSRNLQRLFDHGRRGFTARNFGKTHKKLYSELTSSHSIDRTRRQVVNCYLGRAGLINSGGAAGENDLAPAVRTAVINKRAGGMGLISRREAFQRPMQEGVELLHAIQDVYLEKNLTVA